jgi:hypothetical protein
MKICCKNGALKVEKFETDIYKADFWSKKISLQTPENGKARPEKGCKNESKKFQKLLFIFCIVRV